MRNGSDGKQRALVAPFQVNGSCALNQVSQHSQASTHLPPNPTSCCESQSDAAERMGAIYKQLFPLVTGKTGSSHNDCLSVA
jgi:hypothetical protein